MAKENQDKPKQDGAENSDAVEPKKTGVFARLKAMSAQKERDAAIEQLSENEALIAENEALIERNEALNTTLDETREALETATSRIAELESAEADLLKQLGEAKESAGKEAARIAAQNHVDVEKLPGADNTGDGESPYEQVYAAFKSAKPGSYEKAHLAKQLKELKPTA